MKKRYQYTLDGVTKTKTVKQEDEAKFFQQLADANITATLIPDEPGKQSGTNQSQNNQQNNTDLTLENGLLDSQLIKIGEYETNLKQTSNILKKAESNNNVNLYNSTAKKYNTELKQYHETINSYNKQLEVYNKQVKAQTAQDNSFAPREFMENQKTDEFKELEKRFQGIGKKLSWKETKRYNSLYHDVYTTEAQKKQAFAITMKSRMQNTKQLGVLPRFTLAIARAVDNVFSGESDFSSDTTNVEETDSYKRISTYMGDNAVTGFLSSIYNSATTQSKEFYGEADLGITKGKGVEPNQRVIQSLKQNRDVKESDLIELMNKHIERDSKPVSQTMKDYQKVYERNKEQHGQVFAWLQAAIEEPTYLAQSTVGSLAMMGSSFANSSSVRKKTIPAGIALGTASGVRSATPLQAIGQFTAGALAGVFGTVSGMVEQSFTFSELLEEELKKKGKDFTVENIKALLNDDSVSVFKDPRFRQLDITGTPAEIISTRSRRRGNAIGFTDTIMALIGGARVRGMSRAVTRKGGKVYTKKQIAKQGTAMAIGGGLASEVAGQTLGGQEYEAGEILTEGFAEKGVALTGITTLPTLLSKRPSYEINGEFYTDAEFLGVIGNMTDMEILDLSSKDKIKVENDLQIESEIKNRSTRGYIDSQLDTSIEDVDQRKEAVDLEFKRRQLQDKIKNKSLPFVTKEKLKKELELVENELAQIAGNYTSLDANRESVKSREDAKIKGQSLLEDVVLKDTKNFLEKNFKSTLKGKGNFIYAQTPQEAQQALDQYIKEWNANPENKDKQKSSLDVTDVEGFFIGENYIINKQVAAKKGKINVGGHELLHGIVDGYFESLSIDTQKQTIKNFKKAMGKSNANAILKRLQARPELKGTLEYTTEWFNEFSDAINEGSITYNEGIFNRLKNIVEEMLRKLSEAGYITEDSKMFRREFANGRQVYNFLKDYNASIKNKTEISQRVKNLADKTAPLAAKDFSQAKLSKSKKVKFDAKPYVDELYINNKTGKTYTKKEWGYYEDKIVDGKKVKVWNEGEGKAKRAIDEIKKKRSIPGLENQGYLDNLIAAKYKIKDVPQNFVDDVIGSRFFINHVRRFNQENQGNESLFGWINSQIRNKANSVFNENEAGKLKRGTRTLELDAQVTDGKQAQIEDTDTQTTRFEEQEIKLRDDTVKENDVKSKENKSKFRVELGIKNIGKGKVFKAVETAINSADPITQAKKFITTFEKSLSNILFPMMEKIFPDSNSMVKFRMAIIESIPIKKLIQMQKELPAKDNNGNDFGNIFVKNHGRKSDQDFLSDFMYGKNKTGKNPRRRKLLPDLRKLYEGGNVAKLNNKKEAIKNPQGAEYYRKKAAGITIYERLPVSESTFKAYINGNFTGKKQIAAKSGTKGNNRTKILNESAIAIGKDATPESLTPTFVQDYIDRKNVDMKMSDVIEKINETIDRPADLKFSRSNEQAASDYKANANLNNKQLLEKYGHKFMFISKEIETYIGGKNKDQIKTRKIIDLSKNDPFINLMRNHLSTFFAQHPEYRLFFQSSMASGYGNSIFEIKDIFDFIIGYTGENVSKKYNRVKYAKEGEILDSSKVKIENGKVKYKIGTKWISESEFVEDGKARVDFVEQLFEDMRKHIQANPESAPVFARFVHEIGNNQNHLLKISSPLLGIPLDSKGNIDYVKVREEHALVQNNLTMLLAEAINPKGDIGRAMKVVRSANSQFALSLVPNKFSDKGHDGMIDIAKLTSSMPDFFWDVIVPRVLDGKLDNLIDGITSIVRYTASKIDLNLYRLNGTNGQTVTEYFGVGRVNNASEYIVDVQNELIDQQLAGVITKAQATKMFKSALKLDGMIKLSKSEIKRNHAVRDAHNTIIKYSKTGKTRGMSTFDFDETVGISENFIVAKKGNITEKIASDQWPFVGDDMIADGWTMDFSDFDKVTKGKPGPLFQKMENQIAKYGPENVFILTARGPGSQVAIHEWLKQNGINIPLKNVTGLGQSSGNAKAQWMLDKFAEGYNDMYFVDDALPNVEAVKKVLDQLDIKSKVVQAKIKFSRSLDTDFNKMIERSKGMDAKRIVSGSEAKILGRKGRSDLFVPPAAEDFRGLVRKIIGRGRQGNADLAWFKESLFDPFAKAYFEWNNFKQMMTDEYVELKKQFPDVVKSLKEKATGTVYTNDTAVRVYLWDKAGFEIPGMSLIEQKRLSSYVNNNAELKAFADGLSIITRIKEGYVKPNEFWTAETIATDLATSVNKVGRNQFMSEWIENKNIIFSEQNLNKLEAVYGTDYIDALRDMLYRMETGSNRVAGKNKHVNRLLDWINGSIGAIMFVNIRSAALQYISVVNFLNFGNNNIFAAAKAFANQPQYWKDFTFLINSPMLKQRRAGLQIDVSASELTKAYAEGRGKVQAVIAYMLEKGFTPTKFMDSFAIAMGGSTFYRNQLNFYLKQGMSEAKAKEQAFLDFQEIAEETQQSSRPDMISQQQAGPLGRFILAFQNTPSQMTRITKKGTVDLANNRGNPMANVSKMLYFGIIQSIVFGALQSAMFAIAWGDEDEREKRYKTKTTRIANGVLDTLLRGSGLTGAMIATIKNTYLQWRVQRKKSFGKREDWRILNEMINLSPPMGSKFRKVMSAIKTEQYNQGIGKELGFRVDNPNIHAVAAMIEASTNAPAGRILRKANHIEEAITGDHTAMQRVFLGMGWDMWSLGIKDEELEEAKFKVKQDRKEEKKKESKKKKQEEKKKKEIEDKKKGIKTVRCSGTSSSGKRCKLTTKTSAKTWKCFNHAAFKDGMDRDGDGIKEYRCTGTTSSGKRCKNKTENKNKKCYAHQ